MANQAPSVERIQVYEQQLRFWSLDQFVPPLEFLEIDADFEMKLGGNPRATAVYDETITSFGRAYDRIHSYVAQSFPQGQQPTDTGIRARMAQILKAELYLRVVAHGSQYYLNVVEPLVEDSWHRQHHESLTEATHDELRAFAFQACTAGYLHRFNDNYGDAQFLGAVSLSLANAVAQRFEAWWNRMIEQAVPVAQDEPVSAAPAAASSRSKRSSKKKKPVKAKKPRAKAPAKQRVKRNTVARDKP